MLCFTSLIQKPNCISDFHNSGVCVLKFTSIYDVKIAWEIHSSICSLGPASTKQRAWRLVLKGTIGSPGGAWTLIQPAVVKWKLVTIALDFTKVCSIPFYLSATYPFTFQTSMLTYRFISETRKYCFVYSYVLLGTLRTPVIYACNKSNLTSSSVYTSNNNDQ